MRKLIYLLVSALPMGAYEIPKTAWSFTDSIGLDTHFSEPTSFYNTNFSSAKTLLVNLGVKHFRDSVLTDGDSSNYWSNLNQLAAAGLKGDYISYSTTNDGAMTTFLSNVSSPYSLEDLNEPDLFFPANWQTLMAAQIPYMWGVAQNAGIPLLGPSLVDGASYTTIGNISAYINFTNIHPYPGGVNPENATRLPFYLALAQISGPGVPVQATETGYFTAPTDELGWVSQDTYATYIPRLFFYFWNQGVSRTYNYQLVDDPFTPEHTGLVDDSGAPQEQYYAVQNLMTLLADSATSFTPVGLSYQLIGRYAGSLAHTLLQKTDGTYWLALWQPVSVWDINTGTPISVSTVPVTAIWVGAPRGYEVYTFNANGTVTDGGQQTGQSAAVNVGATVTLLKIGGSAFTPAAGITGSRIRLAAGARLN